MLGKDKWYIVSVYVYNSEYMKEVLLRMIGLINELGFSYKNVIVHRKWQLGPHIEVIFKANYEIANKARCALEEEVSKFLEGKTIEQTISYQRYMDISSRLAQLEEYKGVIEPLRKHLEVVCQEYDLASISTIFPKELYIQIEVLLTRFICSMYKYYYYLSEEEKDIFLVKCMMILTDQYDTKDFIDGGIKYGYMTFQSHYEGFKAQLSPTKEADNKILNELKRLKPEVCDYFKNNTGEFLEAIRMDMRNYKCADKEYLMIWKKSVINMLELYGEAIKMGSIRWNKNHNMNTFFKNHGNNLSDFHKQLNKEDKYLEFLNSGIFLKHRMSINAFYTILPLLNISPLHKHKLCKYVADAVENYYGCDYRKVMEVINRNMWSDMSEG